jgi:hypothetical protein
MSTPQNELHRLANRIEHLTDMFEAGEDGETIFAGIYQIHRGVLALLKSHERLEDKMDLIIKLLNNFSGPSMEQEYL